MVEIKSEVQIKDNIPIWHRVKRQTWLNIIKREVNKLINDLNAGRHRGADWSFKVRPIIIRNDTINVEVFVDPPDRILAALGQEFGIRTDMIRPRYASVLRFPDRWGLGYIKEESTEPYVFRREVRPSPLFFRPHVVKSSLAFIRRIEEISKYIARLLGMRKI